MATTAVVEMQQAATRRAVVRSERFMEWQRELSSSRAGYGGRKREDESSECAETKKYRKSEEEDATLKIKGGSDERGEEPGASNAEAGADSSDQQQQLSDQAEEEEQQHLGKGKRLQSQQYQSPQRKRLKKSKVEAADQKDSGEGDGGRARRVAKQQGGTSPPAQATKRAQRRPSRPSYSPPKEDKDSRLLTRTRGNASPPVPASKVSKRSRRVAQRIANEEPPPPPLKLPKLHLVLTRKEIQEDWMKITGHKYTGKPKKSTLIQRGFGLCTSLTCPSSIRYLNDPQ